MIALLDREPKDGLEYFRGAMQKLLAPYPGSYDLLGKVVAAFYVYEQTEALPEASFETEDLFQVFVGDASTVSKTLELLIGTDRESIAKWNEFAVEMEYAWNQWRLENY